MQGKRGVFDKEPLYFNMGENNCAVKIRVIAGFGSKANYSAMYGSGCRFSRDGTKISAFAAAGDKKFGMAVIQIISLETMAPVSKLMYTRWDGMAMDFHPNGKEVLTGDGGRWLQNYGLHIFPVFDNYDDCPELPKLIEGPVGTPSYLGVTPDNKKLLVGDDHSYVTCYDTLTFHVLWSKEYGGRVSAIYHNMTFDDESRYTVFNAENNSYIIDLNDGSVLHSWVTWKYSDAVEGRVEVPRFRASVSCVQFHPSGKYLAANTRLDVAAGKIYTDKNHEKYNADDPPKPKTCTLVIYPHPAPRAYVNDYFKDSNNMDHTLLSISWEEDCPDADRADCVWHPSRPDVIAFMTGPTRLKVAQIDFGSRSHTILTAIDTKVPHFCGHLGWTPDGNYICANGEHGQYLQYYDPFNGKKEQAASEQNVTKEKDDSKLGQCLEGDDCVWYHNRNKPGVHRFNFHRNGRHILFSGAGDDAVHIYDTESKAIVRSWPHPTSIRSAIWSRDYSRIYVGMNNNALGVHLVFDLNSSS